jgi:hypothetical protein
MASSTSPSRETPWPGWALRLLGLALATWAMGAAYSLRANPEIAFTRHAHALKRQWSEGLSRQYPHKTVVLGGSSCLTSIDPRRLHERHGLGVANAGLLAGMGARVLTRYAFEALREGDTLVVALEPALLSGDVELEPMGVQFALATGQTALVREPSGVSWLSALLDLRPGAYHAFTMIGKLLLRQPPYRYAQSELQAGGWLDVADRRDLGTPGVPSYRLSAAGREWLRVVRAECARRQVRVALTLPWVYCRPADLRATRRANLRFLRDAAEEIPVLREPRLAADDVREHFADTHLHLTAEAAALRTDELAAALTSWATWSLPEMDAGLASLE